jgi:hypothetical protein
MERGWATSSVSLFLFIYTGFRDSPIFRARIEKSSMAVKHKYPLTKRALLTGITAKSKKQRRVAAKRQRKLEARLLASGDTEALAPKVPLQQQTIDLPSNSENTAEGALVAVGAREELRKAMRGDRRAKIKEANFLKGVK